MLFLFFRKITVQGAILRHCSHPSLPTEKRGRSRLPNTVLHPRSLCRMSLSYQSSQEYDGPPAAKSITAHDNCVPSRRFFYDPVLQHHTPETRTCRSARRGPAQTENSYSILIFSYIMMLFISDSASSPCSMAASTSKTLSLHPAISVTSLPGSLTGAAP